MYFVFTLSLVNVRLGFFSNKVRTIELTLILVLGAYVETGALEIGSKIHESLKAHGHKIEGYLGNSLLNMYCKCGNLSLVWKAFNGMRIKTEYLECYDCWFGCPWLL